MEINTEINKIFGTEMAKIFASSISEEEIKNTAQKMWDQLNTHTDKYGYNKVNSEIENYIKDVLLDRLHEKMLIVLKEPINDKAIEAKARELVDKAKAVAEEAIVKSVAEGITTKTLSVWNVHDKFVMDVLSVMHVEEKNRR